MQLILSSEYIVMFSNQARISAFGKVGRINAAGAWLTDVLGEVSWGDCEGEDKLQRQLQSELTKTDTWDVCRNDISTSATKTTWLSSTKSIVLLYSCPSRCPWELEPIDAAVTSRSGPNRHASAKTGRSGNVSKFHVRRQSAPDDVQQLRSRDELSESAGLVGRATRWLTRQQRPIARRRRRQSLLTGAETT